MNIEPGDRFGRWTVIQYEKGKFLCKCDCGTLKHVRRCDLQSGKSQSCGCSRRKNPEKWKGCNEDCFNCTYVDCVKPEYLCRATSEIA